MECTLITEPISVIKHSYIIPVFPSASDWFNGYSGMHSMNNWNISTDVSGRPKFANICRGFLPCKTTIIMNYSWWLATTNIPTASNRNLEIIQFTLLLHASAFIDDSVSKILVTSKWPSFTAEWRALLPRMNIYLWWKSTITYVLA